MAVDGSLSVVVNDSLANFEEVWIPARQAGEGDADGLGAGGVIVGGVGLRIWIAMRGIRSFQYKLMRGLEG